MTQKRFANDFNHRPPSREILRHGSPANECSMDFIKFSQNQGCPGPRFSAKKADNKAELKLSQKGRSKIWQRESQ